MSKSKIQSIALLGATSTIAKDLIIGWDKKSKNATLYLYARNVEKIQLFISELNLKLNCNVIHISEFFKKDDNFDVIINFIGVGDPSKAKSISSSIQSVTYHYDDICLKYLQNHPETKYIFLSSGAVYGSDFTKPASRFKQSNFSINNILDSDKYALSKFVTEVKHRCLSEFNIIDVRVFNYFSRYQNMSSRFFITDLFRAILNNEECVVSPDSMIRDYLTPGDFCQIIECIFCVDKLNMAFDCYSLAPVDKHSLLTELEKKYGLKWRYSRDVDMIHATGNKENYYSEYHMLETIGYSPSHSSLSGIIMEFDELLHVN